MGVLADSYPFLNIMWTMFIFFAWVIWVSFLVFLLIDNFRRQDHSGVAKAGWTLLLIFLPLIGALAYMITRPAMAEVSSY
jgi:Phospholipase_D-nuclease N-terminal